MARRDELLPRESFRQGERVRAYIYDVRQEPRGPQIFPVPRTRIRSSWRNCSPRKCRRFMTASSRSKRWRYDSRQPSEDRAVISRDSGIDPVGACVGMREQSRSGGKGRVAGRKRIDIIPSVARPCHFVVNALAPAEVAKVVMDEEQRRVEVVEPDDQLSLAIGRPLAGVCASPRSWTGWDIDILTEAEEFGTQDRRVQKSQPYVHRRARHRRSNCATAGDRRGSPRSRKSLWRGARTTTSPTSKASIPRSQRRAAAGAGPQCTRKRRDREYEERRHELGVEDELAEFAELTPGMLVALGEKGVKTLDNFADLAGDELLRRGSVEKGGTL